MSRPQHPLTDSHLQQIKNALDTLAFADQQIVLARQAGINVDQQEAQLNEAKDKLLRLKNTYFPNQ